MSFTDYLKEALSAPQIKRLSQEVAIINVGLHEQGNPKKFLDICDAKEGNVRWIKYYSDECGITKIGLFEGIPSEGVEGILPLVQDQIGEKGIDWKYVRAEQVRGVEYEPSGMTMGNAVSLPKGRE